LIANPAHLLRRLILIAGGAELALFVATRLIIGHWSAWEWQPELLRTACRALVAYVLWHFFRDIIFSGVPSKHGVRHPLFIAALGILLSVPLLVGNLAFMGPFTKVVFAATSIVVAIHETFLFVGLVQNLIEERLGTLRAVGLTSAIMTAWHIGAVYPHFFSFWQVFVISCMFGLIYAATRSIWLLVALHALYDALWSATPMLAAPLAYHWGALLLLVALALTWSWVRLTYWPRPSLRGTLRRSAPQRS
jgi:membrane protease YdiL (CAAX protease family)